MQEVQKTRVEVERRLIINKEPKVQSSKDPNIQNQTSNEKTERRVRVHVYAELTPVQSSAVCSS